MLDVNRYFRIRRCRVIRIDAALVFITCRRRPVFGMRYPVNRACKGISERVLARFPPELLCLSRDPPVHSPKPIQSHAPEPGRKARPDRTLLLAMAQEVREGHEPSPLRVLRVSSASSRALFRRGRNPTPPVSRRFLLGSRNISSIRLLTLAAVRKMLRCAGQSPFLL